MSDAPIEPARFRQAMGRLAAGVTVLTTFADGHDHAMTADTLTSVSLDPLLLITPIDFPVHYPPKCPQAINKIHKSCCRVAQVATAASMGT